MKLTIPILILAGGFGTRLKTVVSEVPKPLAPIGNKPFIQILLDQWTKDGFSNFHFLLHYQSEQMIEFIAWYRNNNSKIKVNWVIEESPLGTGGAIANAVSHFNIKGDFLVVNADTYLGEGALNKILNSQSPSILSVQVEDISRYGSVHIHENKVLNFEEKKDKVEKGWINAGVYLLNESYFQNWDGSPFSIESILFPKLVKLKQLNTVKVGTNFIDIGIPEDYSRFCKLIENDNKTPI